MTANETDTVNVASEPFASLSELQHEHISLMKAVRTSPPDTHAGLIHVFLRRAQATGSRLDELSERDAAQAILDYWTTALIDLRPDAGNIPSAPLLAEFDISQADDLAGKPSPFKGLNAFGESDANWFFGREDAVRMLMEVVARERLVMVAGPSGSGKSSLVLAGLVPHLKRAALQRHASLRYLPAVTPGSDPLLSLLQAVCPGGRDAPSWSAEHKPKLRQSPGHFRKLLEAAHAAGDRPALLIVDQFEELFTLCTDQSARRSFIEAILSIVQPEDQNRVILTVREDFLAQAKLLPGLGDPKALFRVPPFTTSELRHVIIEPAERIGLKIHESVVNDLVKEVVGDPAALPLLQFTLKQLWDHRERNRITWDIYQRVGRPSEALKRTAEEIFEGLKTPENQMAAERIFLALVQPGIGAEFLRRRVFRQTLESLEAPDRVERVLKPFADAGLIVQTTGTERGSDRFEVAHETLVRNWPRLAKWLSDRRAQSQELLQLIATAQRWQQSGCMKGYLLSSDALGEGKRFRDTPELKEFIEASEKSEKNRKRWWRYAAYSLIVIFVAFGAFSINFYREQRDYAQQQHKRAIGILTDVTTAVQTQLRTDTIPIPSVDPLLKVLVDTDKKLFDGVKLPPEQIAERVGLLISYSDVYANIDDGDGALKIAKKAKQIAEELSTSNPGNNKFRYLIYKSAFRIGDQLDPEQAEAEYLGALSIAEELASTDDEYRNDVAFVRLKVGDIDMSFKQYEKARAKYQEALETYEALSNADPGNLIKRRDVTTAQRRVGDALNKLKKRDDAEERYRTAIDSLKKIVLADNANRIYRSNLSAALKALALLYKGEDKLNDAEALLRGALEIRRDLSANYKSFAMFQTGFAGLYWYIGEVLEAKAKKAKDANDEAEARSLRQQAVKEYESGLSVGRKFLEASPNSGFETKLKKYQDRVKDLSSATP